MRPRFLVTPWDNNPLAEQLASRLIYGTIKPVGSGDFSRYLLRCFSKYRRHLQKHKDAYKRCNCPPWGCRVSFLTRAGTTVDFRYHCRHHSCPHCYAKLLLPRLLPLMQHPQLLIGSASIPLDVPGRDRTWLQASVKALRVALRGLPAGTLIRVSAAAELDDKAYRPAVRIGVLSPGTQQDGMPAMQWSIEDPSSDQGKFRVAQALTWSSLLPLKDRQRLGLLQMVVGIQQLRSR